MANGERAVVNKHVSAHVEKGTNAVTFLFEVLPGPCLDSYGIHVAQMAHFPKSVIKAARAKASVLEGEGADGQSEGSPAKRARADPSAGGGDAMDVEATSGGSGGGAAASEAKLAAFGSKLRAHQGLGAMAPAQRMSTVRGMAQSAGVLSRSLLSSQ